MVREGDKRNEFDVNASVINNDSLENSIMKRYALRQDISK